MSGTSGAFTSSTNGRLTHEDDHSRDRREARLEQHRRGDERRVGHAGAARRDDPRSRSPDRAGDVLREHRDHLRPQSRRIGQPDAPLQEDPHPTEHEHEVVRSERRAAEPEQNEVRVAQVVRGGMDRAAQRPGEAGEEDGEHDELDSDEQPAVPGWPNSRRPDSCSSAHS